MHKTEEKVSRPKYNYVLAYKFLQSSEQALKANGAGLIIRPISQPNLP